MKIHKITDLLKLNDHLNNYTDIKTMQGKVVEGYRASASLANNKYSKYIQKLRNNFTHNCEHKYKKKNPKMCTSLSQKKC